MFGFQDDFLKIGQDGDHPPDASQRGGDARARAVPGSTAPAVHPRRRVQRRAGVVRPAAQALLPHAQVEHAHFVGVRPHRAHSAHAQRSRPARHLQCVPFPPFLSSPSLTRS